MYAEMHSSDYLRGKPLPPLDQFRPSCRKTFQLRNILDGIHSYHPMTMDDTHFCLFHTTIHSCLLNFQFRSAATDSETIERQRSGTVIETCASHSQFANFLFPKITSDPTFKYTDSQIDTIVGQHHEFYILSLIQAYSLLKRV